MRKIGDPSFFRIVDRLLAPASSRVPLIRWSIDGVDWRRERHSFSGPSHGFTVEVCTATNTTKPQWILLIVKEYWRDANDKSIKAMQWAHVENGNRADVALWLEQQERRLSLAVK